MAKKKKRNLCPGNDTNDTSRRKAQRSQKPRAKPFAKAAFKMISNLNENLPDAASWSESGEMFIISDREKFVAQLSKFFNTNQFESFSKQLNVYGFKKIGPEWEILNGVPVLSSQATPLQGIRHSETRYKFWHPHFRRNGEAMLHLVLPEKNSTSPSVAHQEKSAPVAGNEQAEEESAQVLRERVIYLKGEIANMENAMEKKVEDLQKRYQDEMARLTEELESACARARAMVAQDTEAVRDFPPTARQETPQESVTQNFMNEENTQGSSSIRMKSDDTNAALTEWALEEWPPPQASSSEDDHATIFELAEPILFEETGLNDYTITFKFAPSEDF